MVEQGSGGAFAARFDRVAEENHLDGDDQAQLDQQQQGDFPAESAQSYGFHDISFAGHGASARNVPTLKKTGSGDPESNLSGLRPNGNAVNGRTRWFADGLRDGSA